MYVFIFQRSTIDSNRSEDGESQRKNAIHAIEAALEKYMTPIETQQKDTNNQVIAMRHDLRRCIDTIKGSTEAWFLPRDLVLIIIFVLLHSLLQMFWAKR